MIVFLFHIQAFKLELQYAAIKREQQHSKVQAEEAKKLMVEGNCTNASASRETQDPSHKPNVSSDQVNGNTVFLESR